MRRLLATAGSVLLALPLVLGPAASAHQEHVSFEWSKPDDGGEVSGSSVNIRATTHFDEGVERWQVEVFAPEGDEAAQDFGAVCEGSGHGDKTVEVDCDWNTTETPDGSISLNSDYRIVVTAWNKPTKTKTRSKAKDEDEAPESGDPGTTTTTGTAAAEPEPARGEAPPASEPHTGPERTVTVANEPKPVENVQLAYDKKHAVVTVSWAENPEPDIAGYLVEERFESGDWVLVAKPTTLFWSGHLEKEGTYRYRVAAVRKVGSSMQLKQGPFRQPQSGMTKVNHKAAREQNQTSTTTSTSTTTTTRPPKSASAEGGKKVESQKGSRSDTGKKGDEKETPPSSASSAPPSTAERGPVGSVTFTYDGQPADEAGFAAAGEGGSASPGTTLPRPAVSPIQPGNPGSVETRFADPAPLPAPVSVEEAYDPGFSLTLPYPSEALFEVQSPVEERRILGAVAVLETDDQQRRALLGALAGGLCTFVLSMQFVFVSRKPRPTDLLPASADWD